MFCVYLILYVFRFFLLEYEWFYRVQGKSLFGTIGKRKVMIELTHVIQIS